MKSSRYPHITNIPLGALLRKKKITLEEWVNQCGIFTYDLLLERCNSLGVRPPSREEFNAALPRTEVSSPTEGVVVLPPPPIVLESTGEIIIDDDQQDIDNHVPERVATERKKRR